MTPGGELIVCYRCNGLGTLPDHHGEGRVQCPRCHDGAHLGEQSLSAEELEIDRLRARVRALEAEVVHEQTLRKNAEYWIQSAWEREGVAAQEEREACAALLETMAAEQAAALAPFVDPLAIRVHAMTVRAHAALIRARGGK